MEAVNCCRGCSRPLPSKYLEGDLGGGWCNEDCRKREVEYKHAHLVGLRVAEMEQAYERAFREECHRRAERQPMLRRLILILRAYGRLSEQ